MNLSNLFDSIRTDSLKQKNAITELYLIIIFSPNDFDLTLTTYDL